MSKKDNKDCEHSYAFKHSRKEYVDWQPCMPFEAMVDTFFCTKCLDYKQKIVEVI